MPLNNALRAEWERAGYRRDMGSAAIVPPPPKDFIRVYHLTSVEFAISNIGFSRIKVARFSDLNDPFELMAVSPTSQRGRILLSKLKAGFDQRMGLLCFSADWTNPVLWSHYGVKHRGVCLGFNLRRSYANKVTYQEKRIPTELESTEDPYRLDYKIGKSLLCTKFRHWQYEEEHRVFVKLDGAVKEGNLHFRSIDQNLQLAEVILGPQCSVSLKSVRQLTQTLHPKAVAFKARTAFKFYKVVPDGRTVP